MKRLKKAWSLYFFILWASIALMAPFIANDLETRTALIPYSASSLDYENTTANPFKNQQVKSIYFRHWLGTDALGRDVLAQLIYGSRSAFIIGFGAMLLAGFIGVILGATAAYFGDSIIQLQRSSIFILLFYLLIVISASVVIVPWDIASVSIMNKLLIFFLSLFLFGLLLVGLNFLIKRKIPKQAVVTIPLDLIIGRLIEVLESIPLLFLLVALSALLTPSSTSVILIIAFVAWPSIAKYTRAEVLKVKNLDFVENSRALGLSDSQIIVKHILPNALGPVLISLSFGLAAAILMESTLSFLGIGIGSAEASWGEILASARKDYSAWWLAIFPGLLIFFTVLACNKLSDAFTKN
ncbi:MAG: ABC transporter permease [Flavobacteriales bacterium]|nr:ABC transporter permease [Flavobacteriales bacterium]